MSKNVYEREKRLESSCKILYKLKSLKRGMPSNRDHQFEFRFCGLSISTFKFQNLVLKLVFSQHQEENDIFLIFIPIGFGLYWPLDNF